MLEIKMLSELPDRADEIDHLSAASWPEFLHYGDAVLWGELFTKFAAQQILMLDAQQQLAAVGHVVPLVWDGSLENLPETINSILARALEVQATSQTPNAVCALAALIAPDVRGQGLSSQVVQAMKDVGASLGCTHLIAPVRPTWKARYPLQPMERYITWRREDGAPYDPWIRVHWRMGAEMLKVAPSTLKVHHPISRWEAWTGMIFPEEGAYIVPGALQPVQIDLTAGIGHYDDPNVWMRHTIA